MIEHQYKLREAADAANLSVDSMRAKVLNGEIGYTRLSNSPSGRIRISESDLRAFLERNRQPVIADTQAPRKKKNGSQPPEKRLQKC